MESHLMVRSCGLNRLLLEVPCTGGSWLSDDLREIIRRQRCFLCNIHLLIHFPVDDLSNHHLQRLLLLLRLRCQLHKLKLCSQLTASTFTLLQFKLQLLLLRSMFFGVVLEQPVQLHDCALVLHVAQCDLMHSSFQLVAPFPEQLFFLMVSVG